MSIFKCIIMNHRNVIITEIQFQKKKQIISITIFVRSRDKKSKAMHLLSRWKKEKIK